MRGQDVVAHEQKCRAEGDGADEPAGNEAHAKRADGDPDLERNTRRQPKELRVAAPRGTKLDGKRRRRDRHDGWYEESRPGQRSRAPTLEHGAAERVRQEPISMPARPHGRRWRSSIQRTDAIRRCFAAGKRRYAHEPAPKHVGVGPLGVGDSSASLSTRATRELSSSQPTVRQINQVSGMET